MSAHVLFNLLIELREKRSNARPVEHFFSLSQREFNNFSNTGALYLSHDIKSNYTSLFWRENDKFNHRFHNVIMDVIT